MHAPAATPADVKTLSNMIGGSWKISESTRFGECYNPSTGKVIARVPFSTAKEADATVKAAAAALPKWSETPAVERARIMFKFRALIESHFDEMAALVTREHGKTLAEARAEVQRGMEVVEFACGVPSLLFGDTLPNIASNVDCEDRKSVV